MILDPFEATERDRDCLGRKLGCGVVAASACDDTHQQSSHEGRRQHPR